MLLEKKEAMSHLQLCITYTSSSDISSTLGEAWAQLKKSLADEAEVHLKFSSKVIQKT